MQPVSNQRFGKDGPAETNARNNAREVLLCNGWVNASTVERLFSAWSMRRSYLEDNWRYSSVEGPAVEC
jgi:hypothetical protein